LLEKSKKLRGAGFLYRAKNGGLRIVFKPNRGKMQTRVIWGKRHKKLRTLNRRKKREGDERREA